VHAFADERRAVARPPEPGGRGVLILPRTSEHRFAAVGRAVAGYAVVVRVLAGQDSGPRGAAQAVGDVGVIEPDALRCHSILESGNDASTQLPSATRQLLPEQFISSTSRSCSRCLSLFLMSRACC
jgi:hypothetical protein